MENRKTIIQIGAHVGNDHVTEYVKANKLDLLVLVEPNPNCIDELRKCYDGYNTEIIGKAVSTVDDQYVELHMPLNDSVSQHSSCNSEHIKQHGHTQQHSISVPTISINSLLKTYTNIDRLYVDAEGLDIDIIDSIDLEEFCIPYIMFEYIHSDGPLSWGGQKYNVCVKRLEDNGYNLEKSGYNTIATKEFVHK